jgi:adenine-specific DNA-methyltransferase
MDNYLTNQIITYMGNKRKLLSHIESKIKEIKQELGVEKLNIGDGFSGSGIVSRLFKLHGTKLYTNDIAGYSKTINECYLSSPTSEERKQINKYIKIANELCEKGTEIKEPWVSKHWSPSSDDIKENERVYYTCQNGKNIDILREYIETVPKKYKKYLLAPLLVSASIHNNTNGQFAAFYKDGNKGAYGGKKGIDLKRIQGEVRLFDPILHINDCEIFVDQKDTNNWVREIPELDMVYFDPPYNKHPYNIYYFLLDIINNWDKSIEVPSTYRGQSKTWDKSAYNSMVNANKVFVDLLDNTNAKYIMISYYDNGIISIKEMDELLNKYGEVEKIPLVHKTYNKLKGIGKYKTEKEMEDTKEYLWVVKKK